MTTADKRRPPKRVTGNRKLPYRLASLAVLAMVACGCSETKNPAQPPPRADLQPAVDWLAKYYQKSPPAKGWQVTSVTSSGDQLQIMVAIPGEQASDIKRRPADDQFRLVAGQVCPPRGIDFWQILPAGSGVKVLPTVSGQVFIEVDCAR